MVDAAEDAASSRTPARLGRATCLSILVVLTARFYWKADLCDLEVIDKVSSTAV